VVTAGSPTVDSNGTEWSGTGGDVVAAPIRLPLGATITAVRVRGNKTTTAGNLILEFKAQNKTTNAEAYDIGPVNNNGDPTGDFTLEITGLDVDITQDEVYSFKVNFDDGSGVTKLYNGEIVYEISYPFRSTA